MTHTKYDRVLELAEVFSEMLLLLTEIMQPVPIHTFIMEQPLYNTVASIYHGVLTAVPCSQPAAHFLLK